MSLFNREFYTTEVNGDALNEPIYGEWSYKKLY